MDALLVSDNSLGALRMQINSNVWWQLLCLGSNPCWHTVVKCRANVVNVTGSVTAYCFLFTYLNLKSAHLVDLEDHKTMRKRLLFTVECTFYRKVYSRRITHYNDRAVSIHIMWLEMWPCMDSIFEIQDSNCFSITLFNHIAKDTFQFSTFKVN